MAKNLGRVKGDPGNDGEPGIGVQSSEVTYQGGASGTIPPAGEWTTSIPAIQAGYFLWTRILFTYSNGATTTAYSVASTIGGTGGTFEHTSLTEESRSADNQHPMSAVTGLNAAFAQEATVRHTEIETAVDAEANARQDQVDELNRQIGETNTVLAGAHTAGLDGAALSRVLGSENFVSVSLFDADMPWSAGKTLVFDSQGTEGVIIAKDDTNYTILTKSVSPMGADEPTLLGNVPIKAGLPLTVTVAQELWGRVPDIDDYARVVADETHSGNTYEYYVAAIDTNGNIAWGNEIAINTADYQAQSSANDSGKLLTGGLTPGTFGASVPVSAFATPAQVQAETTRAQTAEQAGIEHTNEVIHTETWPLLGEEIDAPLEEDLNELSESNLYWWYNADGAAGGNPANAPPTALYAGYYSLTVQGSIRS